MHRLAAAAAILLAAASLLLTPAVVTAEEGKWVSRTQLVLDEAMRELVRRRIEVWDPAPSAGLEFYWEPEPGVPLPSSGRLTGKGTMTWRLHGTANYDPRAIVSAYVGEFQDGRKHGHGRLLTRAGGVYEGSWREGLLEGAADIRFENGDEYRGEVKAGALSGRGRYIAATGEIYEGNFLGGKRDGVGLLTPTKGAPRNSHWRDGVEVTSASDLIPVQYAPGGTIEMSVTVDLRNNSRLRKLADGAAIDPVVYTRKASDGEILIVPEDDVYQAWKGEGPLYHLHSNYAPIARDLSGENNYQLPAMIRVALVPRGGASGQAKGLYLEIAESTADLQPFLGIFDGPVWADETYAPNTAGATSAWPYDPTFKLVNTGWGAPVAAQFSFAFSGDRGSNQTRAFEQTRGAFADVTAFSVEKEIAALGADVAQLKSWKFKCPWSLEAAQFQPAPLSKLAGCQAQALSQLRLGQLRPAAFFVPQTGLLVTTVEGTLRYDWIDVGGRKQTSTQRLIVRVLLATVEIEGPAEKGYAPEDPEAGVPILELAVNRKNYRVSYPLKQPVTISGAGKQFILGTLAQKSSNHLFRIVAELADGQRVVSQPVRLTYARPRPNPALPKQ